MSVVLVLAKTHGWLSEQPLESDEACPGSKSKPSLGQDPWAEIVVPAFVHVWFTGLTAASFKAEMLELRRAMEKPEAKRARRMCQCLPADRQRSVSQSRTMATHRKTIWPRFTNHGGLSESTCMLSLHVTCRFTNSFNTNNPATDMKPLFLDDYEAAPGRLGAWRLQCITCTCVRRFAARHCFQRPLFLLVSIMRRTSQLARTDRGTFEPLRSPSF